MLIIIVLRRKMDMQEVRKYILGPLLWSLSTADDAPANTANAKWHHILEVKYQSDDVSASAIFEGVATSDLEMCRPTRDIQSRSLFFQFVKYNVILRITVALTV